MAFFPADIIAAVEAVAVIDYIDASIARPWNEHRDAGELRLLTGWRWIARNGRGYRQGFKTWSVAARDAYYELVAREAAPVPGTRRPRLRVIRRAG